VSVLSGLVLDRVIWGDLAVLGGAKVTLGSVGLRDGSGPLALIATFALSTVFRRSCLAFTTFQFLSFLSHKTLKPQHSKPPAVRPPIMIAMVAFSCIAEA
jgi:hypothetical protein